MSLGERLKEISSGRTRLDYMYECLKPYLITEAYKGNKSFNVTYTTEIVGLRQGELYDSIEDLASIFSKEGLHIDTKVRLSDDFPIEAIEYEIRWE